METNDSLLAPVRSKLEDLPHLREAFDEIYAKVTARSDVALLLAGSLVDGHVSDLSDLDCELVVAEPDQVQPVRRWAQELVAGLGSVLARFPADHIGMNDLDVTFLERDSKVVKVDVWTLDVGRVWMLRDALVLHDPGGRVAKAHAEPSPSFPPPRYSDLDHKFCGWMWFTFGKIRRDHLFESVESLDFMRGYALMPFLHLLHENPPQGFRNLEARLPPQRLDALHGTYPHGHDRAEIERAFWAMVDLFRAIRPAVRERLGQELDASQLERMYELIRSYGP
jgi:hypothetical protein